MRRTYVVPVDVRNEIVNKADDLAKKLIADDMDKEDATDLVGFVIGEGLELVLELAGMSDPAADAIGKLAAKKAKALAGRLGEALKPDVDVVLAKAVAAMKAGHAKKARRLFAKAERITERQAKKAGE